MLIHDHCNFKGGSKNLWLSVVCDVLSVCVFVLRVWWLQRVWFKDDQWGESVLYLLPYLFLCAQHLKSCIELYWGQEAVNKVGLKCNVFFFFPSLTIISYLPSSVTASTTNTNHLCVQMVSYLHLLPDISEVECKQDVWMLWPDPVYLQTPQCFFCLDTHC